MLDHRSRGRVAPVLLTLLVVLASCTGGSNASSLLPSETTSHSAPTTTTAAAVATTAPEGSAATPSEPAASGPTMADAFLRLAERPEVQLCVSEALDDETLNALLDERAAGANPSEMLRLLEATVGCVDTAVSASIADDVLPLNELDAGQAAAACVLNSLLDDQDGAAALTSAPTFTDATSSQRLALVESYRACHDDHGLLTLLGDDTGRLLDPEGARCLFEEMATDESVRDDTLAPSPAADGSALLAATWRCGGDVQIADELAGALVAANDLGDGAGDVASDAEATDPGEARRCLRDGLVERGDEAIDIVLGLGEGDAAALAALDELAAGCGISIS